MFDVQRSTTNVRCQLYYLYLLSTLLLRFVPFRVTYLCILSPGLRVLVLRFFVLQKSRSFASRKQHPQALAHVSLYHELCHPHFLPPVVSSGNNSPWNPSNPSFPLGPYRMCARPLNGGVCPQ